VLFLFSNKASFKLLFKFENVIIQHKVQNVELYNKNLFKYSFENFNFFYCGIHARKFALIGGFVIDFITVCRLSIIGDVGTVRI